MGLGRSVHVCVWGCVGGCNICSACVWMYKCTCVHTFECYQKIYSVLFARVLCVSICTCFVSAF